MTATTHLYEIFIAAPRQRVWDALVNEDDTTRYFHGTRFESTFEPGAAYVNRIVAAGRPAVDGVIEEFDPPNRLAMTWHVLYDDDMAQEPASRVEWTLTDANPEGSVTRVTLRHGDLASSPKTWANVQLGWVGVLGGLKTLLETGQPMPAVDTSPPTSDDVEGQWHRTQGVLCNNGVWDMVAAERTPANDEEMLRLAYASAYHWQRAARRGPENEARALYMLAKAHLLAGNVELSMRYADADMAWCRQHGLADFDLAYAHEARARALAALGRSDEALSERVAAKEVPVDDPEDLAIVEADLAAGPWFDLVTA